MSRQQVTLESLVRDYLSTHADPPEYPEDIVHDRDDCQEVQAALERAIVPELETYRQQSFKLYDALKARLDPAGQELLGNLLDAQGGVIAGSEALAWTIGAAVQRQILLTPCPN